MTEETASTTTQALVKLGEQAPTVRLAVGLRGLPARIGGRLQEALVQGQKAGAAAAERSWLMKKLARAIPKDYLYAPPGAVATLTAFAVLPVLVLLSPIPAGVAIWSAIAGSCFAASRQAQKATPDGNTEDRRTAYLRALGTFYLGPLKTAKILLLGNEADGTDIPLARTLAKPSAAPREIGPGSKSSFKTAPLLTSGDRPDGAAILTSKALPEGLAPSFTLAQADKNAPASPAQPNPGPILAPGKKS